MNKRLASLVGSLEPYAVPLIGMLFIYSGARHLANPQQFLASIIRYQLLNSDLVVFIAMMISPLQIMIGINLVFPKPWSLMIKSGAVVSLTFFAAQFLAWSRGLGIDCGCFGGSGDGKISVFTMAIPLFCAATLAIANWHQGCRLKNESPGRFELTKE